MNIFKTRYRVRFDDDEWMYVLQYRKWWQLWWSEYLLCSSYQHTCRVIDELRAGESGQ